MAKIIWDSPGEKFYEYGVDRGVLYPPNKIGRAWNGLTGVDGSSSGGEPTPYYLDAIKYYNRPGRSEFSGVIKAYTYPDQLEELIGFSGADGLIFDEQEPIEFGLSYRTMIGSDTKPENGYKIHLVYNALIPTHSHSSSTTSSQAEISDFTWSFTTTPVIVSGKKASSHVIIDSRRTNKLLLTTLEDRLYGKAGKNPYLPSPNDLIDLFENYQPTGYGHGPFGHTLYGHGSEY